MLWRKHFLRAWTIDWWLQLAPHLAESVAPHSNCRAVQGQPTKYKKLFKNSHLADSRYAEKCSKNQGSAV